MAANIQKIRSITADIRGISTCIEAEGKEYPAPWLKNGGSITRGTDGRFASSGGSGEGGQGDSQKTARGKAAQDLFNKVNAKMSAEQRQKAGDVAKGAMPEWGKNVRRGVPPEGQKAFDQVVDAAKAGSPGGVVAAAKNAGKKALRFAKEHPTEVAIGVVSAVGLAMTAHAVAGAVVAHAAWEVGAAEFIAAEEGAALGVEAEFVAGIAREIERQSVELVAKLQADGIANFEAASAQEIAKFLGNPFSPMRTAIQGLFGTAYLAAISGMATNMVADSIKISQQYKAPKVF